jgi:hypothetical protein
LLPKGSAEPGTSAQGEAKPKVGKIDYSIRSLRIAQHTLAALLATVIAALQMSTYAIYQNTKDIPGAWPEHPNIYPILLLGAVAMAALIFDICALIAYISPLSWLGDKAYYIAVKMHYTVAAAKTLGYAIAAVLCKTGYEVNTSNASFNDLWSYACSAEAMKLNHVNQAGYNCHADVCPSGLLFPDFAQYSNV